MLCKEYKLSEETRQKMSEVKKGKPGRRLSGEAKIKISETLKLYNNKRRETRDVIKIFWSKVIIKGKDDCWEWTGNKDKDKYGLFYIDGINHRVHRFSFTLSGGILNSDNPLVLHRCDNPGCVNPAHLFAGSQKDNIYDCIKKGRRRYITGEKHHRTKLSDKEVSEIRDLRVNKVFTYSEISKLYPISQSAIWNICNMRHRVNV
jgi:hypothetical protein